MFKYSSRNKHSLGQPRCGIITSEPEVQKFQNESERTVFELTGISTGKTITCVYWGVHLLEKGQTVTAFGFEKENDVFIVQNLFKNYTIGR